MERMVSGKNKESKNLCLQGYPWLKTQDGDFDSTFALRSKSFYLNGVSSNKRNEELLKNIW